MKNFNFFFGFLLFGSLFFSSCLEQKRDQYSDYHISPVEFNKVRLHDGFWKDWVMTVRDSTLPFAFQKCEETGRIDNFRIAGGLKEGKFQGKYGFNDSDLYKIMEGASYALMIKEDPVLEAYLDSLVYYISAAQEDDGYLYTAWTLDANEYTDFNCCTYDDEGQWLATMNGSHELYNVGHMYEAAVAYYQATGKRAFLDVAVKNADLVYDVIITKGNNFVPGHQEIEIGLIKLFRLTGDGRYLELAKHLLDIRAEVMDGQYAQAHLPVTEQKEAVGHAVRANYMYASMADVAALSDDTSYMNAIDLLWSNVISKKLSVTGGIGASHDREAYGKNYDLPNHPYNETCAAIANVYWNHRMFMLHGDAKYIDVLERSLYNGVISGLGLEGNLFFYPNTLRHDGVSAFNRGVNGRSPWFSCSCCPSNLSRIIPSVAGYAYASREKDIYINLFMNSEVSISVGDKILQFSTKTDYPWKGEVEISFLNEELVEADLLVRIPGWARDQAVPSDLFQFSNEALESWSIQVNGETIKSTEQKGYARVKRKWKSGDQITIHLPMESRILIAHEKVKEKEGLLAVQYGPLIYCAEEFDNKIDVLQARIKSESVFEITYDDDLLGGVNQLNGEGLSLIPYYAWANRKVGKMNVWFDGSQGQ